MPFSDFAKMRYNHIPDDCFNEISRELDNYSSPLFMCHTHLLIANDGDPLWEI